ncbi:MAG: LacI family transcriptional regulator [Opitutaceae bacterium]|jgi:LacI family transcriptional regulator|nr:LacI family transcriptional regulator [Opitutaceae bacterium]
MTSPGCPVTTASLAREAGVSQSTVSLALRDDPRVRESTRLRIRALADERGYIPDPALSALVAYRARTRAAGDFGKIAVLHDLDRKESGFPVPLRQQVAGMRERARRLGYDVELFRAHADQSRSMRLSSMLYARGIRGLILLALRMPTLVMRWEHFSAVVVGEYFSEPRLNHVNHHQGTILNTIYAELRSLGYRKIGFCNIGISEERKHHIYLGAYLKCLWLDGIPVEDSPPLFYDEATDWSPVPWIRRHRFDAVMTMFPAAFLEKLKGTRYRVPQDLGLAGYSIPLQDGEYPFSGYAIDHHRMGAAAVDTVQSMIHRGLRGVPRENELFDLFIRGQWVHGKTTSAR